MSRVTLSHLAIIAALTLPGCGASGAKARMAQHRWEPYQAAYAEGMPRITDYAVFAYRGDAAALEAVGGALIGTLRSREDDKRRLGFTAAAYGATHMLKVSEWVESEVQQPNPWAVAMTEVGNALSEAQGTQTTCTPGSGGSVSCTSHAPRTSAPVRPTVVNYTNADYALIRVSARRWHELPAPLRPGHRTTVAGPDGRDCVPPLPPPQGCKYTHRDLFGRHDQYRLFVQCPQQRPREVKLGNDSCDPILD